MFFKYISLYLKFSAWTCTNMQLFSSQTIMHYCTEVNYTENVLHKPLCMITENYAQRIMQTAFCTNHYVWLWRTKHNVLCRQASAWTTMHKKSTYICVCRIMHVFFVRDVPTPVDPWIFLWHSDFSQSIFFEFGCSPFHCQLQLSLHKHFHRLVFQLPCYVVGHFSPRDQL